MQSGIIKSQLILQRLTPFVVWECLTSAIYCNFREKSINHLFKIQISLLFSSLYFNYLHYLPCSEKGHHAQILTYISLRKQKNNSLNET